MTEALPSAAIVTRVSISAGQEQAFAAWQARATRVAADAAGFISLEISQESADSNAWRVLQRYREAGPLSAWQASAERKALMADLQAMAEPSSLADAAESGFDPLSYVTEVITTVVEPGKVAAFAAWQERLQARQAMFPGYLGTLVQAPVSPEASYWTALVRFSTPAQLDAWLGSAERKALLDEAEPGVAAWKSHRMASPFAGWFPGPADQPAPAAWKQTALVLLVLFPVVMLEIRFLSPILAGQHPAVVTFIGNAISVSLVSWPLMKIAVFCMKWWLDPAAIHRWRTEIIGGCVMLGLYAIELATFMWAY